MTTLNYPSLLSSHNLRAFLRVIREGESNQEDDGPQSAYRAMYHPTQRKFYSGDLRGAGHPQAFEPLPDGSGRKSSAFGAYQFVWTTWNAINEKYGLPDDIAPYVQDCHAVALIYDCGALDDVIDGNLDAALRKCGSQWASLPGSSLEDGGSKVAYDRALAVWTHYGGGESVTVATRPPLVEDTTAADAPHKEEPMAFPILPIVMPLLQSLIEGFSSIGRAKATEALTKKGLDPTTAGGIADSLLGIVKNLASQGMGVTIGPAGAVPASPQPAVVTDPVVAVGVVKQSPALMQQAEAQFLDYFDRLAPILDQIDKYQQASWKASEESANAAAARYAARPPDGWDMTRTLVWGMLVMMGFLLLFVAGIAGWQTFKTNAPSTEVWAAVTGLIGFATGIAVTVFAFRFGYSRQSGAKDALLSELATRRPN